MIDINPDEVDMLIQLCTENNVRIPLFLFALKRSDNNPKELMINLGLKKRSGGQSEYPDGWLEYGGKVFELVKGNKKMKIEAAVAQVLTSMEKDVDRETMRKWFAEFELYYNKAMTLNNPP